MTSPCTLGLSCFPGSNECYFSGNLSFSKDFFTGQLHIGLFTLVWVTSEVDHCLQITLRWNKLIAFRSITNGHGDILELPVMAPACLCVTAGCPKTPGFMASQHTYLQIRTKTGPNIRSHYIEPGQILRHPLINHVIRGSLQNWLRYSYWCLFVCLHFTGWEFWCCRQDVSQCQEHMGISIKGQHEWRQGAHPWILLLARVPNQCKSLRTW